MYDIKNYFNGFSIGNPGNYENLTLFPLYRDDEPVIEYLMLDEALAKSAITITEINETGRVSELKVRNDSDIAVLLLDGEELAGSKQDRILNTTILVAPNSTLIIPVSCVEQGRWHYKSRTFYSGDRMYKPTDRGKKARRVLASMKVGKGFSAGQSEVWEEVACLHKKFGNRSKTHAMADVYDDQKRNLDAYIKGCTIADGQTGFVALINGKIIGLEVLSRSYAMQRAFPKFIRSYALDAIDMRMTDSNSRTVSTEDVTQWIFSIDPKNKSMNKSPGLGDDLRWDETGTVGCMFNYDKEIIHAAVFSVVKASFRRSDFIY